MYILAGDTQLTITSYGVNRHDNKRGLVLTLKTTSDNISLAGMDELCENIRANSLDILVYDDNNELVKTLRGFRHNCLCSKDSNTGVISAEITCESENTFQIGLLQDRSATLEETAEKQGNVQTAFANELADQANVLLDQGEALAMQTETVMILAEASEMQTLTIESLLLEVLPELMASTVEEAVANALAANSTPEDTTPEEDSEVEVESASESGSELESETPVVE